MTRFDDRAQPKGKDGDDFQRFVWEALKRNHFEKLLADRHLRPYFASGRDGAIDHVAIGDDDQIVFECKFFGKDRSDNPDSDWDRLAVTLGNNLRDNAAGAVEKIHRLYKPWFDVGRPIKGYWFCTSGIFTPGGQSDLRQKIKDFFAELAREFGSLSHLANIDIEVLGWNDFDGALADNLPLKFRWFQELPVGLRPIRVRTH